MTWPDTSPPDRCASCASTRPMNTSCGLFADSAPPLTVASDVSVFAGSSEGRAAAAETAPEGETRSEAEAVCGARMPEIVNAAISANFVVFMSFTSEMMQATIVKLNVWLYECAYNFILPRTHRMGQGFLICSLVIFTSFPSAVP